MFNYSTSLPQPLGYPTSGDIQQLLSLPLNSLLPLFAAVFNERKIIVQSSSPEKTSLFIACLLEAFAPYEWQHLLIPFLPVKLTELTQTPTPFIIGVDPSVMQLIDMYDVFVFVDIDNGTVKSNDATIINSDLQIFPKKWITSLSTVLTPLYSTVPSISSQIKSQILKSAFLDFMTYFTQDIEDRVKLIVQDGGDFNLKEFTKDFFIFGEGRKFIEVFSRTATFDQFVQKIERKLRTRGIAKVKRKPSLMTWLNISKETNLVDISTATVVTPQQANPPVFTFL
ncbi:hypothetical protein EIN_425080 [Entamoeba invadens IP1]|uniref:UDENN domain-containing protein n=1 Tax=Entamoeba invadens IP1 TaxID=370355 RepID=A0A0A1U9E0_ENTIV|nr:hypothetical protein EIN_425080 [Entamoeba invadens IP1]ELP89786.1 hypothetical protein EIN_425080 [Entamoeba invadens IP1]|eukprot:XP_004256557.1 hypothetical protein EIN_425080 [Entamoeba invadens IP1]